jgi:hypothetical protein
MKTITFEEIVKKVLNIEEILKREKIIIEEKELLGEVLMLDNKHHGWTGDMRTLPNDREEWKEAAETVKLIREWDKNHKSERGNSYESSRS